MKSLTFNYLWNKELIHSFSATEYTESTELCRFSLWFPKPGSNKKSQIVPVHSNKYNLPTFLHLILAQLSYQGAKRRRWTRSAETQLGAVTDYAMAGDRQSAFEAGCTGYIEKPIDPETIMTQIKEHLHHEISEENE